jgi:Protein of unknown function, DUF488
VTQLTLNCRPHHIGRSLRCDRHMTNPQFNHTVLASSLAAAHLEYVHCPALGGLRHPSRASRNTGWRNKSFRGYADYMQTESFAAALQALVRMSHQGRLAIMCAEAVPWRCHRSLVADALNVRGSQWSRFYPRSIIERINSRHSHVWKACRSLIPLDKLRCCSGCNEQAVGTNPPQRGRWPTVCLVRGVSMPVSALMR